MMDPVELFFDDVPPLSGDPCESNSDAEVKLCNSLFPLAANRITYQANNNEVKHKCDRGRSPPMSRGR